MERHDRGIHKHIAGITHAKRILAGDWNKHPVEFPGVLAQDGWVIKGARTTARTQIDWALGSFELAPLVYSDQLIEDTSLPTHSVLGGNVKLRNLKEDVTVFK